MVATSHLTTTMVTEPLSATVAYLANEPKYNHEKPYDIKYESKDSLPSTNVKTELHQVKIHDLRNSEHNLSFERNGISVLRIKPAISYEDFSDTKKIVDLYLPQLAQDLRSHLGAARVQIFEHVVSHTGLALMVTQVSI